MAAETLGTQRSGEQFDLRNVSDTIPAVVVCALPDGSVEFINRAWREFTGTSIEKLSGWGWQTVIHPDDLPKFIDEWNVARAAGKPFENEARVRRADGQYRWFLIRNDPLRDQADQIVRWYGAGHDIEDRKQVEEHLRLVVDTTPALIHTARPDGYLDYFNKPWLEYLGVTLDKMAGWNWTAFIHPEDVEGILAKWRACLATGEIFEYETRVRSANGDYRWMFHRKVPLRDANGNIVKWYGSSLDIEERKTAEGKIREQETEFQQILDLAPQLIAVYGPNRERLYANRVMLDYHGLSLEEWLQFPAGRSKLVHPDEDERIDGIFGRAVNRASADEVELRLRRRDGTYRWFLARFNPLRDEQGQITRWYVAANDIEDRKQAEDTLRLVVDTTPAFLHSGRPDGYLDYFNQRWLEYFGLPLEDVCGWRWTNVIHPEDVEGILRKWRAALASGEPFDAETRVRRADGEYRWMLHRKVPLRDGQGNILKWYGSSLDIEDRKQAEDKVRKQEIELRQILDLTPQLVAVYGPNRERLYANPVTLHYLGLSLEEWQQPFLGRESPVHPDDRDRVDSFFNRGSADEMESRLRKRDGTYRWFLTRYNPLRDEQGHITRWYVASTDIEDRKRAEEKLQQENVALREEIDKASMFEEIVGTSRVLQTVLSLISKVAPGDSTVLITGETGTGKELVARAIHRRSDRASRAFVSVNCAAIPRDLIASELFGHEKGAFTGATQQRLGRFELANGGTIFLDEVGELPTETQIALLRVLQEHEFERVGGGRGIRADVRVVAATNRNLQAAISGGAFRSDLFYRLNVFPIEMPSLRERREDIPLLVEYFIDRYARRAGKNIKRVSKKTLELLQSYLWPGNIRELQNVIERSIILCETEIFSIDEKWLPKRAPTTPEPKHQVELPRRLLAEEKDMIEAALKETRGRIAGPTGAAVKLGIPRSTLESKIRSLKINKSHFNT